MVDAKDIGVTHRVAIDEAEVPVVLQAAFFGENGREAPILAGRKGVVGGRADVDVVDKKRLLTPGVVAEAVDAKG